jgi:hypothetical protein
LGRRQNKAKGLEVPGQIAPEVLCDPIEWYLTWQEPARDPDSHGILDTRETLKGQGSAALSGGLIVWQVEHHSGLCSRVHRGGHGYVAAEERAV